MNNYTDKCQKLHKILQNGKRFTVNDFGAKKLNKQRIKCNEGVYIAFQKDEFEHGVERIVRVSQTTSLYNHIRRHYGNPWNDDFGDKLPNMSRDEMKKFMAENITFCVIDTESKPAYRKTLKNKIYSTLKQCEKCRVQNLWQDDKINNFTYYKLTPEDFDFIKNNLL